MGSGPTITSPDGDRWQVRRRWVNRPLPDLWNRFRRNQEWLADKAPGDGGDVAWLAFDNLLTAVVLVLVAAIVVLVLLPLLGVALELVFILFLLFSGIAGRVVLRRPWTIEAENLDDATRFCRVEVRGWRASGRAIDKLRTEIAAGRPPEDIAL